MASQTAVQDDLRNELEGLIHLGKNWNIPESEIDQCIKEVFFSESLHPDTCYHKLCLRFLFACGRFLTTLCFWAWTLFKAVAFIIVLYLFLSQHNSTQRFLMKHSQELIYPVLRTVRVWTLPALRRYPHLTEWYSEMCLLENPFYNERDVECWPCEDVRTVVDLTTMPNYSSTYCDYLKPFVVRDVLRSSVTLKDLKNMYADHKNAFDVGSSFDSTSDQVRTLQDLFSKDLGLDSQATWKVHRIKATRILRQVFKRPYFVSNRSEVSLLRYVYVDGPMVPQYVYPKMEFTNIWLAQGQGFRLVVLTPVEPCKTNCSTVSILLKPKDVLYYSTQLWYPRSLPARLTDETSITFIGSFY